MTGKTDRMVPRDSAEALRTRISEDARREANEIGAQARKDAAHLLEQQTANLVVMRDKALDAAAKEGAAKAKTILATISQERRKIRLEAQEKVLQEILSRIRGLTAGFRVSPAYGDHLKELIVEGALTLDTDVVIVVASVCDVEIMNSDFLGNIERALKEKHHKSITLILEPDAAAKDIGVILRSKDRRIACNNTFEGRLSRAYAAIRAEILNEVFGTYA